MFHQGIIYQGGTSCVGNKKKPPKNPQKQKKTKNKTKKKQQQKKQKKPHPNINRSYNLCKVYSI